MQITTRTIEPQAIDDTQFEACSEGPKPCGPCDRSGEATLSAGQFRAPVTSLKDLLLD